MELKSLAQRIKCVEPESGSLRMFLESLVVSSMRLGVTFIAPRQLEPLEIHLEGNSCLLSGGTPDCPVAHLIVNSMRTVRSRESPD